MAGKIDALAEKSISDFLSGSVGGFYHRQIGA
jgi:hypothetical protein